MDEIVSVFSNASDEDISHLKAIIREKEIELDKLTLQLDSIKIKLLESEKMASLGQLTAGIAHEIKNPLNFITNFSELSMELTRELREELDKQIQVLEAKELDYLKGIISDLESNVQKINEHGRRADSIIRGMLLHSRGTAGERIPTDINALLAEYVNLGYHGMRATDNTFNIKLESEYDTSIGMIQVVPQDISRVFLNMINNAFFSTAQKKTELKDAYVPVLRVTTKNLKDKVEIRIWDNGKGISREVVDKIFTAFFTTKPAGLGTGLGLSISYDIMVRQHQGEIHVNSEEGEFAEFIITIPIIK